MGSLSLSVSTSLVSEVRLERVAHEEVVGQALESIQSYRAIQTRGPKAKGSIIYYVLVLEHCSGDINVISESPASFTNRSNFLKQIFPRSGESDPHSELVHRPKIKWCSSAYHPAFIVKHSTALLRATMIFLTMK